MIKRSSLARRVLALSLASAALGLAPSAHATLIASDSFSYTQGQSVHAQAGGSGWAGGWITGQASAFQSVGPIGGAPAIGQTGGALAVLGSGRVFRKLDLSPGSPAANAGLIKSHSAMYFNTIDGLGAPGTTVWIGLLVGGGDNVSGDETQYHLYDGAQTDPTSLALGDNNKNGEVVAMLRGGGVQNWGFERTCLHSNCAGGAAAGYWATNPPLLFGGTHWSVTRYVFKNTTTEITMWRDPAPGMLPPSDNAAIPLTPYGGGATVTTVITPAMYFDTVAPNASGNFGFVVDELRIGTSFADLSQGAVSPPGDGGTGPADAAPSNDASATDSGSPTDDAGGAIADAGDAGVGSGAAIVEGCNLAGASSTTPSLWTLLLFAVGLRARRRR